MTSKKSTIFEFVLISIFRPSSLKILLMSFFYSICLWSTDATEDSKAVVAIKPGAFFVRTDI